MQRWKWGGLPSPPPQMLGSRKELGKGRSLLGRLPGLLRRDGGSWVEWRNAPASWQSSLSLAPRMVGSGKGSASSPSRLAD